MCKLVISLCVERGKKNRQVGDKFRFDCRGEPYSRFLTASEQSWTGRRRAWPSLTITPHYQSWI